MSDELHASYSRNLANQSVQKGLIKFAKARGLSSPEIWQHNGEWAMRYTGTDGEVKQLSLGQVFAKARSVIASLSAPKVALAEPQAIVKELMQRAQAVGLKTARITFDGKNYRMQYGGRLIPLGPSRGEAMAKIGKVKPSAPKVALSIDVRTLKPRIIKVLDKAQGQMHSQLVKGMQSIRLGMSPKAITALEALVKKAESVQASVQASQVDDVARLKKMFPDADVSVTPDGKFKIRSSTINVSDADLNAVIKKAKALSLAVSAKTADGRVVVLGSFKKPVTASLSHPLQRLNALALSEVVYHAGYYMQGGNRIGKTEAEATEKLS